MKRFIAFLCMLTCVFGLTACGGEDTMNVYQTEKVAIAEQHAVESIIPLMDESVFSENVLDVYYSNGYTAKEWESAILNNFGFEVEGEAYMKGLESFITGYKTMGAITGFGEVTSKVDGEEILVYVDVIGEVKNGQVEMILSNDLFTVVKSCTLNVESSFGELMAKAGMNTLLGVGSVFTVLVLIMCIIYLFNFIPKIQDALAKKKTAAAPEVAAPVAAPVVEEVEEEADDLELVAVIAAAIAAYEGQTSTDGFVVRSIKKSKRR
jgi:sodium pump decarboxylase gamma subunit